MSSEENKVVVKSDEGLSNPSFLPRVDNGFGLKKGRVREDMFVKKDKTYVTLQIRPLPGDILKFSGTLKEFYIVKFDGFGTTRLGGFRFEVKRTDGYPTSSIELDSIKKGTWTQVYGYFKDCKDC